MHRIISYISYNNKRIILYKKIGFILLFVSQIILAQTPTIDTLKQKLARCANTNDSVNTMCELVFKSWEVDLEQAFKYADMALETSGHLTDSVTISRAIYAKGVALLVSDQLTEAEALFRSSLEIAQRAKHAGMIAWICYNLSECLIKQGKINETEYYASKAYRNFMEYNDPNMAFGSWWILVNSGQANYFDTLTHAVKDYLHKTEDVNEKLNFYFYLAGLYRKRENRKESMLWIHQVMELAEEKNNQIYIVKAYNNIAEYLTNYQHNYPLALTYYNKILEKSIVDSTINYYGGVFIEMGDVYRLMGNDSMALVFISKGLKKAEKKHHRHTMATAYMKVGELTYQQGDYEKSKYFYLKCYETGCDYCPKITFHDALVNIGNACLFSDDIKNAYTWYQKGMHLADSANNALAQIKSYQSFGRLYEKQEKVSKAIATYLNAYNKSLEINYLEGQQYNADRLSNLYKNQNQFESAYKFLNISKILSDSILKTNQAENLAELETRFDFMNIEHQRNLEKTKSKEEIHRQKIMRNFTLMALLLVALLGFIIYVGYRRKIRDNKKLNWQKTEIEEISRKASEADQKRLSFFSNISHELRTPLTLILGPVDKLFKKGPKDPEEISLLKIIRRNTYALYNLINQLLDIRKLDTGNVYLQVRNEDIINFCKGVFASFAHLAEEKSIQYTFKSGHDHFKGFFDHNILEKALNNLLSNAFKHTPINGVINFTMRPVSDNSGVVITITDNGEGIPEDQVQYVFDRYYQVENTNTGFNTGTGIGLAYTKELVELHKGKMSLSSIVGKGTTFTIEIPINKSKYAINEISNNGSFNEPVKDLVRQKYLESMIDLQSDEIKKHPQKTISPNEKVLLIIEDNPDLRTFIRGIFEKEFTVCEAPDGQDGLQLANDLIPDVIISDIMMPEMDGLELCKHLKNSYHTSHIPVLLLTAKIGDENELQGLKTGADDYLSKPFNSDILYARVNGLLEQKRILREHFQREFIMKPKEIKLINPNDKFIKKAVDLIEENIMNPELNVEMLMKELGVSRTQLFRKIKAITNDSVGRFIRNIRLKSAAQLLEQDCITTTEVMYQSGFNNRSYFKKCFQELYGCQPKEYAVKIKNKELSKN